MQLLEQLETIGIGIRMSLIPTSEWTLSGHGEGGRALETAGMPALQCMLSTQRMDASSSSIRPR